MKIETIMKLILIVFGIYLVYQIFKKLIGGSLSIEEVIMGLIFLNLGWTIALQRQLSSKTMNLQKQFSSQIINLKDQLSSQMIDIQKQIIRSDYNFDKDKTNLNVVDEQLACFYTIT